MVIVILIIAEEILEYHIRKPMAMKSTIDGLYPMILEKNRGR